MNTTNTTEQEKKEQVKKIFNGARTWRASWGADYHMNELRLANAFYALKGNGAIVAISLCNNSSPSNHITAMGECTVSIHEITLSQKDYLFRNEHKHLFEKEGLLGKNPKIILCKFKTDYFNAIKGVCITDYWSSAVADISDIVIEVETTKYRLNDLNRNDKWVELNRRKLTGEKTMQMYVQTYKIDTISEVIA